MTDDDLKKIKSKTHTHTAGRDHRESTPKPEFVKYASLNLEKARELPEVTGLVWL